MEEFLKWIIANPALINGAVILLGIILITMLSLNLIVFVQGRDVRFWPPGLVENKCVILDNDTYFMSIPVSSKQRIISKEKVTLQNKDFLAKDELHITIIGSSLGSLIKEKIQSDHLKKELFLDAIAKTNWCYKPRNKFFHMAKEKLIDEEGNKTTLHLESIIQLVNIPELDRFYKRLDPILQIEIPSRPAHITLYTFGNQRGIGIDTQSEFDEYSHGEINLQQLF